MFSLAISSLFDPRAAISRVLRWQLDDASLFQAAILLACLTGLTDPVVELAASNVVNGDVGTIPPFGAALSQLLVVYVTAFLLSRAGRVVDGSQDFLAALKVSIWFGFVSIPPILLLIVLSVLMPAAAPIVFLLIGIWLLVIMAGFVQELHGIKNRFLAIVLVILISLITQAIALLLTPLMSNLPTGGN